MTYEISYKGSDLFLFKVKIADQYELTNNIFEQIQNLTLKQTLKDFHFDKYIDYFERHII